MASRASQRPLRRCSPRPWSKPASCTRAENAEAAARELQTFEESSCFFIEKDVKGAAVNYVSATQGQLKIVPEAHAREALAEDYAAMLADDVMIGDALSFDQLMQACAEVAAQVNNAALSLGASD